MLRSVWSAASAVARKRVTNSMRCGVQHSMMRTFSSSDDNLSGYPGASTPITTEMSFHNGTTPLECFRVLDEYGKPILDDYEISISDEKLLAMYRAMQTMRTMDMVFYDSQRQGRISFYMTSMGEEAAIIGSAAALDPEDVVYAQYRESGCLLWRGFSLQEMSDQLFSNEADLGKGRQMPIHYGSRRLNYHTISSPLGTQIPHAVGAAYAKKREGNGNVVMCYFGEGAASEGDAGVGFNMASTLDAPVVFFCRNNGFAISTPSSEQYRGDGIAARGLSYGIRTIRIDGNDLLACYDATLEARNYAAKENRPVFVEAMTYRGGHHSTSDDSTAYRSKEEIEYWSEEKSPLNRTRLLLENRGIWDGEKEIELNRELRKTVLECMKKSEGKPRPPMSQLFMDVYDEAPQHLKEQEQELMAHLEKYGSHYGLDEFAQEDTYQNPGLR